MDFFTQQKIIFTSHQTQSNSSLKQIFWYALQIIFLQLMISYLPFDNNTLVFASLMRVNLFLLNVLFRLLKQCWTRSQFYKRVYSCQLVRLQIWGPPLMSQLWVGVPSMFYMSLHLVLHQVIIYSGKPKRLPGKGRLTLTKARYPRSKITLCTCSQSQVVYRQRKLKENPHGIQKEDYQKGSHCIKDDFSSL